MMSRLHSALKFTSRLLYAKDSDRASPPPPPPKDNYDTPSLDIGSRSMTVIQTERVSNNIPDSYHGVLLLRGSTASKQMPPLPDRSRDLPLPPTERRSHPSSKVPIVAGQQEMPSSSPPKRRFIFDEQERKRKLEEDLRLAAEIRRQREEKERREEEELQRAILERRQRAKQKRLEYGKAAQEWRSQHVRQLQESTRREREQRERVLEARRMRSLSSSVSVSDDVFSGWVSAQSIGSPVWRRRYCRVRSNHVKLYKDSTPESVAVAEISLEKVMNLKDCSDDFEELESLPHAFAIQVQDDTNYAFMCDNEESKAQQSDYRNFSSP
ncbi:unnamed protein product [Somion occarium]|uniref:PH domain-containing protein n=1 Tax=Somion occarium TaxID=3059160 RepID=A0ABP1E4R9_9APHY